MNAGKETIQKWAEEGTSLSLPGWESLPAIPLYMDQVLLFTGEQLGFFERNADSSLLTKSMVNNYVKNGTLPRPDRKKYEQPHLAALLMICILKQVLSIQDIDTLLSEQPDTRNLYETFLQTHTKAVHTVCASLKAACEDNGDLVHEAMRLAAEASAKRVAAERILVELAAQKNSNKPREKDKSKKKEKGGQAISK